MLTPAEQPSLSWRQHQQRLSNCYANDYHYCYIQMVRLSTKEHHANPNKLSRGNRGARFADPNPDPATVAALKNDLGLADHAVVEFARFASNALQGDFGLSYTSRLPVGPAARSALWVTLQMAPPATLLAAVFGIGLGLLAAVRKGPAGKLVSAVCFVGASLLAHIIGPLTVLVFGIWFRILPTGGWGTLRNNILPTFVLCIGPTATIAEVTRTEMLAAFREVETIRTPNKRSSKNGHMGSHVGHELLEHNNDEEPEATQRDESHIGHAHSHGPAPKVTKRIRRLLAAITIPLVFANAVALAVLWPKGSDSENPLASPAGTPGLIGATVTGVDAVKCSSDYAQDSGVTYCEEVTIRLTGGPEKNRSSMFQLSPTTGVVLRKGNKIYVERIERRYDPTNTATATDEPDATSETSGVQNDTSTDATAQYVFYDFQRERPLLLLTFVFCVAAIVIGRKHGARALVALALSLGVLITFMLPAIIEGRNPLLVALIGSSAVMFVALYLSHGISARTTTAVLGTVTSLGITGALAWISVRAAHFTGLSGEEANYVRATAQQIDLKSLLLAGIIIGALGVLDDVTVTQASAVWELHAANPSRGFWPTYHAAIRIGRDHIASVVNTLVLAYAGAALPLLVLFTQAGTPFGEVVNGEPVATEIVRMLAGSIGLIAAVPITTLLTTLVVSLDHPGAASGDQARITDVKGAGQRSRLTLSTERAIRRRPRKTWQPPKAEREFGKYD
jgi:uncharacterized membrane protein